MRIKQLKDEDFVNYKKPSMFIACPLCTWKCEKECGIELCQNKELAIAPTIVIDNSELAQRYVTNDITKAIVFGGLEPMDSFYDMYDFIHILRRRTNDDIVIYSGYKEEELENEIYQLKLFTNIIIKFGRYIPNEKEHYDEVLGVNLASNNQYAKRITAC